MKFFNVAIASAALAVSFGGAAQAWEVFVDKEKDGRTFVSAEQTGEAGSVLSLVCIDNKFHVEIVYPASVPAADDFAELVQVDGNAERLLSGYIEKLDRNTSVFVALDRRDRPAAATDVILKQIRKGNEMYLGDPDAREAIERWSLKGATAALSAALKRCQ